MLTHVKDHVAKGAPVDAKWSIGFPSTFRVGVGRVARWIPEKYCDLAVYASKLCFDHIHPSFIAD